MNEWEDIELSLLFKELVILKDKETKNAYEPKESATPAEPETSQKALTLVICCPTDLLEYLNAPNSNLHKITAALKIEHIHDLMSPLDELIQNNKIGKETSVWAIGLRPEEEEMVKSTGATKVLYSADPEQMTSVEEKRNMFEGLKNFLPQLQST